MSPPPRRRVGPDGYYGSSDWSDELPRPRRVAPNAPARVVDPERVDALLDGRSTGAEHEAALGEIAASDDDADVFADTVAVPPASLSVFADRIGGQP